MRLVATEHESLDGVVEEPCRWSGPFDSAEAADVKWADRQARPALPPGRRTHAGFADARPARTNPVGFAVTRSGTPKYVLSSTMDNPAWSGSRLPRGDVPGDDARPFADGIAKKPLSLTQTTRRGSGVLILEHEPTVQK